MKKNNFYKTLFLLFLLAFQLDVFSQDPWQRLRNKPSVLALGGQNIKLETKGKKNSLNVNHQQATTKNNIL